MDPQIALNIARIQLRNNLNSILQKLDKDEWISLIFLIYDETNSLTDGFKAISDIFLNRTDKMLMSLISALTYYGDNETTFDPLIEAFYHLGRFDILDQWLKLCIDHSLYKVCHSLDCLHKENVALYQVFSQLTQEDSDRIVSQRLPNWHSHDVSEMFEVKFLRNLGLRRKGYRDLITEIYGALVQENFLALADTLKMFIIEEPRMVSMRPSNALDMDEFYAMPQRDYHSLCVIINVDRFVEPRSSQDDFQLEARRGSDIDRDLLQGTFKLFGYQVQTLDNPDYDTLSAFFRSLRMNMSMAGIASLAVCVMTHGDRNDNLYLSDRNCIPSTELRRMCFARFLIGKPKMFFIQACRGNDNLRPMLLQRDAITPTNSESDCIICEATVSNYSAMRSQSLGSWYIADLCSTLQKIGHVKPLRTVLQHTRRKLNDRVEIFRDMYTTQLSEEKDTLLKEIQLRRGNDTFVEGILDLTELQLILDLIEGAVAVFASDDHSLRSLISEDLQQEFFETSSRVKLDGFGGVRL